MRRKTVGAIRHWIDENIFTILNKASLLKQITPLQYIDGDNMSEHLSSF